VLLRNGRHMGGRFLVVPTSSAPRTSSRSRARAPHVETRIGAADAHWRSGRRRSDPKGTRTRARPTRSPVAGSRRRAMRRRAPTSEGLGRASGRLRAVRVRPALLCPYIFGLDRAETLHYAQLDASFATPLRRNGALKRMRIKRFSFSSFSFFQRVGVAHERRDTGRGPGRGPACSGADPLPPRGQAARSHGR
jgi:hypothetical protein